MADKFLTFTAGGAKTELFLQVLIIGIARLYGSLKHAIGYTFAMTGFFAFVHAAYLTD
jgi:hypothetical protein